MESLWVERQSLRIYDGIPKNWYGIPTNFTGTPRNLIGNPKSSYGIGCRAAPAAICWFPRSAAERLLLLIAGSPARRLLLSGSCRSLLVSLRIWFEPLGICIYKLKRKPLGIYLESLLEFSWNPHASKGNPRNLYGIPMNLKREALGLLMESLRIERQSLRIHMESPKKWYGIPES